MLNEFQNMLEKAKWMVIDWLIRRNVLAVVRCRADKRRGDRRQQGRY